MQVSVENTGELGRRMKVQVPANQIDGQVEQRIRELGRGAKLKGFRPGKVPFKVLEQRYGDQIRQDVLKEVLRDSFRNAVSEQQLRPAGTPEITAQGRDSGTDLEYTAEFDVFPEIQQLDVSDVKIERPAVEVTDADIDNMIDTLRRQRREWEQVERGAQTGDLVMLEYTLTAGDQRFPEEGMERAGTVMGSNALLPGLEAQLDGVTKGDAKSATVTLPDDFQVNTMAGKEADAELAVLGVSQATLPEMDADFIKSFGVASGDPDEFKGEVRSNLERELHQSVVDNLRRQVVDGLLAEHQDLNLPESLIDEEAKKLQSQADADKTGRTAEEGPSSAYREQARTRIAAGFLLSELARQHNIEVDPNLVRQKIAQIAATYEQPQEVVEAYQGSPELAEQIQGVVLEEQVMDWVVQHASVTEKPMSFDELMRPGAQAEQ